MTRLSAESVLAWVWQSATQQCIKSCQRAINARIPDGSRDLTRETPHISYMETVGGQVLFLWKSGHYMIPQECQNIHAIRLLLLLSTLLISRSKDLWKILMFD